MVFSGRVIFGSGLDMGELPVGSAPVDGDEGERGDDEEEDGGVIGLGIGEVLDLVVDGDGEGAGGSWDVSANHEYDAEFAYGVGEDKCDSGEYRSFGEWEEQFAEDADASGAEQCGLFAEGRIDGLETGDERLYRKGEAVDDGADDESPEGEGEGMADDVGEKAARGGLGAEKDEKVEAEDGGWEQQREGTDGFDDGAQAGAGEDDPGGDGCAENEEDEGGDGGEAHGEPERGEVNPGMGHYFGGSRPEAASSARILGVVRNWRKRFAAAAFFAPLRTTAPWMRGA